MREFVGFELHTLSRIDSGKACYGFQSSVALTTINSTQFIALNSVKTTVSVSKNVDLEEVSSS